MNLHVIEDEFPFPRLGDKETKEEQEDAYDGFGRVIYFQKITDPLVKTLLRVFLLDEPDGWEERFSKAVLQTFFEWGVEYGDRQGRLAAVDELFIKGEHGKIIRQHLQAKRKEAGL